MADDLIARLEAAETEDEEREALRDAMQMALPIQRALTDDAVRSNMIDAINLLDGPRAGWIGVALLMVPEAHWWQLDKLKDHGAGAWVGPREPKALSDGNDSRANLPSCALCIASLKARTAMSGDKT
jgi:hypothetical protein